MLVTEIGDERQYLCMEVLHQLDFAYFDLEPVYEECLRDITGILGLAPADEPTG